MDEIYLGLDEYPFWGRDDDPKIFYNVVPLFLFFLFVEDQLIGPWDGA